MVLPYIDIQHFHHNIAFIHPSLEFFYQKESLLTK